MGLIAGLRRLRHGPLKFLAPLWLPLGRFYRQFAQWLPMRGVLQKIGPYGPFRLDPHFAFSDFAHWGGGHNNAFEATVEACRGKSCIFDIGGHVGLVSMPVSQVLAPGGRVFAFEPGAANLRFLRRHLELNGIANVEVLPALVGETDGEVAFYEQQGPTGQNSVALRKKSPELYSETRRPQVALDEFCKARGLAPDVIKIDVEGAELMVLRGAKAVLAQHRPLIFLSVHPRELEVLGASTEALVAFIAAAGYVCREIDGRPVEKFRLAEYLVLPREAS